jgi:hypothetical protein
MSLTPILTGFRSPIAGEGIEGKGEGRFLEGLIGAYLLPIFTTSLL